MPLFWAVSSICFGMLKVKFWKPPTKNNQLQQDAHKKLKCFSWKPLRWKKGRNQAIKTEFRPLLCQLFWNSSSFLLPNTVCSMRSELSPVRLSCAAWVVAPEFICKGWAESLKLNIKPSRAWKRAVFANTFQRADARNPQVHPRLRFPASSTSGLRAGNPSLFLCFEQVCT